MTGATTSSGRRRRDSQVEEWLSRFHGSSWSEFEPAMRTELVIHAVGTVEGVADLLGVSKSQPSRWRQGKERPNVATRRLLLDLEHVMARAHLLFTPEVAWDWLTGSNAYLEGARPIDVLRMRGASEVIDALDAATQDAFS